MISFRQRIFLLLTSVMVKCQALNCKNKSEDGIQFFKFPSIKNREQRYIWAQNSGKTDIRDKGDYRLCQKHFKYELIVETNGKIHLVEGSIPTIFLPQNDGPVLFDEHIHHDHAYAKNIVSKKMQ